jgi:hypothetical protein
MNRIERYEMMRGLPQDAFDTLKYIYNSGHTAVFERIAAVIKYAIAALLAYIAYDQYDINTLLSVLSGASAVLMAFRKKLISFFPSIISTIKMTNKITSKDPKKVEEAEKVIDGMLSALPATIRKKHENIKKIANELKK